jgi:aspartyl-tRNA(Asn)/glutamyl-tRNA(Gln) amidotransferase subunit C
LLRPLWRMSGPLNRASNFARLEENSFYFVAQGNRADMKISREDVLRVAELAHLELTPAEVDTFQAQLDQILDYVDKLKQVDVEKVEPMSQVLVQSAGPSGAHPELRDDVLVPCTVADAVLAQAPDAAKPFFRVPRVIER